MWKEVFNGETAVDRYSSPCFAGGDDSRKSRRVSAASDDSFDASSYVHVDSKLNSKMPKCLLSEENNEKIMENHFTKTKSDSASAVTTKSGKRVIRKRLSISEFNASRLRVNLNNNSNANSSRSKTKELQNSSSSDNDTLPKTKKRNTDVLSAKIQHLMFEMKRLRQLDRDILRQFLIINDTIEEQKWMVEEKQEAIKRCLSEEGEDPVTVNFDLVPEVPEEQEDDEESIQSVLSRQSSQTEIFRDTPPEKKQETTDTDTKHITKDSDLVSTSSDSALSMSGGSSTLSSTTSLPVSNRSSSPPTSNLSTTSASSSYIDAMEMKCKANEIISTARTEPPQRLELDFEGEDIEGYYRMHGSDIKRGSYPLPRQSQSFDAGYSSRSHTYDDYALDSAYSTRRGSTDSDSRDAAEYAMIARGSSSSRSYAGPFRTDEYHTRQLPRSVSVKESLGPSYRVQRICVRPDGSSDQHRGSNGIRRSSSVNERGSASQRLLQHPMHQRHLARLSINRAQTSLSFIPIAEQEPDVVTENGRLLSNNFDHNSYGDSNRRSNTSQQEITRQKQHNKKGTRQCPPVIRNASAAGSAGSYTSSSRTSSSSLTSSSSNSSMSSPTKYNTNEADRYYSRPPVSQEPVWVQRNPTPAQPNNYTAKSHSNQAFSAPLQVHKHRRNQATQKYPDPALDKHSRAKPSKHIILKSSAGHRTNQEKNRVLTVSLKPKSAKGTNDAVYNWIQTQDDITYL